MTARFEDIIGAVLTGEKSTVDNLSDADRALLAGPPGAAGIRPGDGHLQACEDADRCLGPFHGCHPEARRQKRIAAYRDDFWRLSEVGRIQFSKRWMDADDGLEAGFTATIESPDGFAFEVLAVVGFDDDGPLLADRHGSRILLSEAMHAVDAEHGGRCHAQLSHPEEPFEHLDHGDHLRPVDGCCAEEAS